MISNDKIYGLVLAGGKSTRMGKDKSRLHYHGQPHALYLYERLSEFCGKTFLSVREASEYPVQCIEDDNQFKGPFNGMLSAHRRYPEAAWLVMACDLPFVNREIINSLITLRHPQKAATAFATKSSGLPEPLCALWEAQTLAAAVDYLKSGAGSCPRKFLLQQDLQLIYPQEDDWLFNANSPEDFKQAQKLLKP